MPSAFVFLNSSIIKEKVDREDLRVIQVPCDTIANELGNGKVANMVMLGAYIAATGALKADTLREMIRQMFTGPKAKLVDLNTTCQYPPLSGPIRRSTPSAFSLAICFFHGFGGYSYPLGKCCCAQCIAL